MRPLRQLTGVGENAFLTSIGIFSLGALLLGCSGTPDPDDGTTSASDTSTAPTSGDTSNPMTTEETTDSGTTDTENPDGPNPNEVYTCMPGIPVTTQAGFLLNREYDRMVEDLLGVTGVEAEANQRPSRLLTSDTQGAIDTAKWQAYQDVGEAIAQQVIAGPNKSKFITCDPATVSTCYEDTVKAFGRKAFRRPVSTTELDKFMALTTIEPAGTPDQIAETLLYAFLVSPSFILVPEIGTAPADPAAEPGAPDGAIQLTQHEIAMRLSRMLWGRGPDDILAQAADDGLLGTKEQIAEQAARMMAVPDKAAGQVATAHRAYAQMDDDSSHWWKADHDPALFPTYNADAKDSLSAEYDAFFQYVAFNNGTFADLFTSNKGFVNAETAPFYDLNPAEFGAELEPYDFPPGERPGFLTRAGFLSSFSNYAATSPILRGAFIAINVIGVKVGAPDPAAITMPVPPGDYNTRRKQIDALTADVSCKKCHQEAVNPPGYLLENFDAMGAWQVTDQLGGPIETAAGVGFDEGDVRQIADVGELMTQIAAHPNAKKKYAQKLVSVGMARLPNNQDACVRDELVAKLESSPTYPIVNLFSDMTTAQSFRLRVRGE